MSAELRHDYDQERASVERRNAGLPTGPRKPGESPFTEVGLITHHTHDVGAITDDDGDWQDK